MRGLSIRNLTKKYNGEISALNDVSFEVESGEIVGLIGSNGAGKSTTIKVCTRLLQGFSGEVCLGGEDIRSMPLRNYPVSYIPDEPVCFEFMTVGEHLEFAAGLSKNRGFMDADDLIDRLEMGKHLDKNAESAIEGDKTEADDSDRAFKGFRVAYCRRTVHGARSQADKRAEGAVFECESKRERSSALNSFDRAG